MISRIAKFLSCFIVFLPLFSAGYAQGPPPRFSNERFVIKAMDGLHRAQATYSATIGAGNYGSLAQLRSTGLIDEALASGAKYGYAFVVTPTGTSYTATATPIRYKKNGLWSYYIDQDGVLFGRDKNGLLADRTDIYVDTCAFFSIDQNESCTIGAIGTLHTAEMTYAATVGNGQYCLIAALYQARLIDMVLGVGAKHGYSYTVTFTTGPSPTFQLYATPMNYGVTGIRSFFIDQTGILRGADRGGFPARPTDPPIDR
jgi:hypothetical protein